MTAHIILTTLALMAFALALKIILKKDQKVFPWKLFTFMAFIVMPISFSGMTVIAHFLFVSSSESMLGYSLVYLPLLLLTAFLLWKVEKKRLFKNNILRVSAFSIFIIFIAWYLFAITQSQYEKGTPFLTQNIETIFYWLSIQTFIISLFAPLLNFVIKNKNILARIVVALMAVGYIAILFATEL